MASLPGQTDEKDSYYKRLEGWFGFAADGQHFAVISRDETVILHDIATGKEVRRERRPEWDDLWKELYVPFRGQTSGFPPLESLLVEFRFAAAQRWQVRPQFESGSRYTISNDQRILACCRHETISIIEARTGQRIATFQSAPIGDVNCVLFGADSQTLITGSENSSITVWDWAAAAKLKPNARSLPDSTTWDALASDNARKAYRAIFTLLAHPNEAMKLLHSQLQPASKEELTQIRSFIVQLDDDAFAVRDRARRALTQFGEDALAELKRALKQPHTAETEQSLRSLIALAENSKPSGDSLRQIRAIQTLEWMNTPNAQQLLKELANGEPGMLRTKEAAIALKRTREKDS